MEMRQQLRSAARRAGTDEDEYVQPSQIDRHEFDRKLLVIHSRSTGPFLISFFRVFAITAHVSECVSDGVS